MNDFNIEVESGTSKRLLTAGKYCDRDIVVNATGGVAEKVTVTIDFKPWKDMNGYVYFWVEYVDNGEFVTQETQDDTVTLTLSPENTLVISDADYVGYIVSPMVYDLNGNQLEIGMKSSDGMNVMIPVSQDMKIVVYGS